MNYLTTEDVSKIIRRCKETVRRKIRKGELEAIDIGGQYLFTQESIDKFLASKSKEWLT